MDGVLSNNLVRGMSFDFISSNSQDPPPMPLWNLTTGCKPELELWENHSHWNNQQGTSSSCIRYLGLQGPRPWPSL